MAMQRMIRRLAEAAVDSGEAQAALKELGVDAKALVKLPFPQQLREIADAFKKVANSAHQVRLGFKLVDSEGVPVISLFRQGSKAIGDAEREAEKFGIAITKFDARKFEVFRNTLIDIWAQIRGLSIQTSLKILPTLDKLARVLSENLFTSFEFLGKAGNTVFEAMLHGLDLVIKKVRDLNIEITALALAALQNERDFFNSLATVSGLQLFGSPGSKLQPAIDILQGNLDRLTRHQPSGKTIGESISDIFRSLREQMDRAAKSLDARLNLGGGLAGLTPSLAAAGIGRNQFRQIDPTRTNVPGVGGKAQRVFDPQLKTTNQILRDLRNNQTPVAQVARAG